MQSKARDEDLRDFIALFLGVLVFIVVLWSIKFLFNGNFALALGVALGSFLGLTIWIVRIEHTSWKHAARSSIWISVVLAAITAFT